MKAISAINRKLLRDLWSARWQVVTIALVIGAAISGLISMVGTYRALSSSRELYYERTDFPDVFAHLGRAPEAVAARLRAIAGVTSVETRLTEAAVVKLDTMQELATAQVLSLPGGSRPTLDGLVLRTGRNVEPGRTQEALVLEAFFEAHHLALGDELRVTFGGRQQRVRVVGTLLSPEFVFSMSAGGMMPDDKRFVAVYLSRDSVEAALGAKGTFNDVTLRIAPGEDAVEIARAVDRVLAPFGGRGAVVREDQPSHRFVSDELAQLETMAIQIPVLFLLVGVFLINVVLSRLVATQREQIAALRALGYGSGAVARHYLGFVAVVAVMGSALAVVAGGLIGRAFCAQYATFFRFPVLAWHLDLDLAAIGTGTAVGVAALGALRAVGQAARLPPAEAMRPPSPARYRKGVLSRLGLLRLVPPTGRMVVRELERRPVRALISVFGLGAAIGLVIVGNFTRDTIDELMDTQFQRAMGSDVTVSLVRDAPLEVLSSARELPGVLEVEPTSGVPVRLHAGHRRRDLAITGMPDGAHLRAILDRHGRPIEIDRRGLTLAVAMATRLRVGVGDVVTVERLDDHRTREVQVVALSDEMVGRTAYMGMRELAALWDEEPRVSALLLRVDPLRAHELARRLATLPGVAQVAETQTFLAAFENTTASFSITMTAIVLAFGLVIAVGVVYNNGRVTLAERERELATLRVLGFSGDEVSTVVLGEMIAHLVVGIPLGLWLGTQMADAIMGAVDAERYRMAATISFRTYALAALAVVAAAAGTAMSVARRLRTLDPSSALKARD